MATVRITERFKPGGHTVPPELNVALRWYEKGEQFSCPIGVAEWFEWTGCGEWLDKPEKPKKRGRPPKDKD